MKKTKMYSWKQLLVVSSLIFGMFFGSGNLIFPVHLGQLAGQNWMNAGIGFSISGALFPLLAILAVVATDSDGLYDLAKPVGKWYATLFLILVHLTIGPLFGTPRTAATAFEMAVKPFLPENFIAVGMFAFSAVFFLCAYFLTVHPTKLVKYVGKYLNTLFLILLAIVFFIALIHPMRGGHPTAESTYQSNALINGVLEGYNTVDAVALLALSITFVHAIRDLGFKNKQVTLLTAKAGILSIAFEVVIYFGLVLLGTMSLNKLTLSENGGTALSQIIQYYLGRFGVAFLGVMITLGVFTTAIGLLVSFAQDFHKLFPKVGYLTWLRLTTFSSFIVANAGLNNIIQWSLPILMLLYPLSLTLILLSLTAEFFEKNTVIYKVTMLSAAGPAVLDMLGNLPSLISQQPIVVKIIDIYYHIPLASLGLGWVLPTIFTFIFCLSIFYSHKFFKSNV